MNEFNKNDMVTGKITGISKYGLFLKINDNYSGLIHISEVSNKYVRDIRKYFVIGEEIKTRVLSVDNEKKQLKLSIKGIKENEKAVRVLKESGKGFQPLKEKLDFWVEKTLNSINISEKK